MKAPVKKINGKKASDATLPTQFEEYVRDDIIARAVLAIQTNKRQRYGAKPEAGMRHHTDWPKRRRKYRTFYGRGVSRSPRKILLARGRQMHGVGAKAPNTVGGRRAHPPKSSKKFQEDINNKERRKAIRAAIAATSDKERVRARGHRVDNVDLPLILESSFEETTSTKHVRDALVNLGLEEELDRCKQKNVRPGKGTMRNRKYKRRVGPLLVAEDASTLKKAASNIPGVDVVDVYNLNAELLAPGTHPGRLVVWTENAINTLQEENLYA